MYHCHVHFYLAGQPCRVFEILKEMAPLACFTHKFFEGENPQPEYSENISEQKVVFANLEGIDREKVQPFLAPYRESNAELIVLAGYGQTSFFEEDFSGIKDIWTLPMNDGEIRFRLRQWQETYKLQKDFLQEAHYLDATINNIPNLIWYKDKDGIHKKVNDSFCRTVGKEKWQVEGQGHAYIWDVEQDDPACIESEQEVMSKRTTCISEETILTGGGTRTLTTYKSPLYDLDGSVMGTVGVGIDVTKERAYEQELIRKNRMMEQIFKTIDCGVMWHSLDGKHVLNINRAALKILGYESQEELEAEGFDMVAPSVIEEDKQKLRENINVLHEKGDMVSVEYRVRHKNGEIIHVMGNVKLLEENGELYYQRFLLDCTAQKLEEKKKERRQMELIQALGIDYNLVCYFDLDEGTGVPLRIDDSPKGTFGTAFDAGLSFEESMEQYIENSVYVEDQKMLRESIQQDKIISELTEKHLHYVNYRIVLDGKIFYYRMKIVRAGEWDENHGIVLGIRSVDEEIQAELEKKNLLEDALAQANRASKAKSIFLSNMSHDIRTPMNAIVGFTALAITHSDHKEQVEEYLKKIMTSGNHLLSLINDVLDMSRIESGKMHLDEKPCRLPDILHGLRNILQADIYAKQLELYIDTVDIMDEDIYCDKLRLNQVLLNLLSNAVKYTKAGGIISLRITEKTGAPEGCARYEFYIKDTGIGMSEEFVAHIFEPFEREKSSTISGIQGTGLGMAITKNIVDMMNGSIEVRSEQNVGTEITLGLTFRVHSNGEKQLDIPELKGSRALVVDDDFNTCDSVSYMLTQLGMRAEWTMSGKEAVLRTRQALTRGDNYCVYLLDWMLPDINGVEVARRIRKETGEDVPIIVLTAYDWSDIEEEAREAGVTAFCSKPLFLSELRSCLYSAVSTKEEKKEKTSKKSTKVKTGRILLAEDNELNQEIATAILGDAGFETEVASNGQIAVEMLKKSEPGYYQLVLMDVRMPVMDGYEATKAIRSLENKDLALIPILAMTANAFEEDKQAALECGMNGHLAKPIDVEALFKMLDRMMD